MRRAHPNPTSAGASLVRFSTSAFSRAPSAGIGAVANVTSAHDDYNGQIVKIAATPLLPGIPGRGCA